MRVLKIGGNELGDAQFLTTLAQAVQAVPAGLLLVHGGGQAIAELQSSLGLTAVKVDGLRVTDAASLTVAEMVLSGQTNKRLVRALRRAGVDALGLSGVDGGLLRCRKKQHATAELGFVGEIESVRVDLLRQLIKQGFTPVISPISLGPDGEAYNVNADEAATAIAAALEADLLDFVSNVPGVLQDGQLLPTLTPAQTAQLIQNGVIHGGMIPKVQAALGAVAQGVRQARIVNLAGLAAGGGTYFHSNGTAARD